MKKVKFGKLPIGSQFLWREQHYLKIDDCWAKIIRNGEITDRKVEFGESLTVEVQG